MSTPLILACGKNITMHSLDSRQPINVYNPHRGFVNSVNINHSNKVIASCGQDGKLMLVNAEEPTSVVFEHSFAASKDKSTSINCCMFSSDSKYIAAGSADSLVKLWELHKNNDVNSIIKSHIGSVTSLAWIRRANQGEILASASSIGDIYLHTAKTSVVVQMLSAKSEPVNMIRVLNSQKQNRLAACTSSGSVMVWDLNAVSKDDEMVYNCTTLNKASVTSLSFSQYNDALLVAACADQNLVFYDLKLKKPVKSISTEESLTAVNFHPNGHTLVAGGMYGGLFVYDLRKLHKPKEKLIGHETAVKCIDFYRQYQSKDSSSRANKTGTSGSVKIITPVAVEQKGSQNKPVVTPPVSTVLPPPAATEVTTVSSKPLEGIRNSREVFKVPETKTNNYLGKAESKEPTKSQNKLSNTSQEVIRQAKRDKESIARSRQREFQTPPKQGEFLSVQQMQEMQRRIKDEMYDSFERLHLQIIRQFQLNQQEQRKMLSDINERQKAKDERIRQLQAEVKRLQGSTY